MGPQPACAGPAEDQIAAEWASLVGLFEPQVGSQAQLQSVTIADLDALFGLSAPATAFTSSMSV